MLVALLEKVIVGGRSGADEAARAGAAVAGGGEAGKIDNDSTMIDLVSPFELDLPTVTSATSPHGGGGKDGGQLGGKGR